MQNKLPPFLLAVFCVGVAMLPPGAAAESKGESRQMEATAKIASALVQQAARAVQTIDNFEVTHQVDITSITLRYKETTHSYVKTWIDRPKHIRAESQHQGQNIEIVSTGKLTWFYNGATQKYWKQSGSAPATLFANAFPGLARQLSDANLPSAMMAAKIDATEPIQIKGRSFPCDVVEVSVKSSASKGALKDNFIRLWISREYKVPLKVEATFLGPDGAAKEYSDYVTDFQPDLKIAESLWEFHPPEGASLRSTTSEVPRR